LRRIASESLAARRRWVRPTVPSAPHSMSFWTGVALSRLLHRQGRWTWSPS